jgi:hypothetical protein
LFQTARKAVYPGGQYWLRLPPQHAVSLEENETREVGFEVDEAQ